MINRVIALEEGAFVPRFKESFPRKGSMIFVCEDKESATWMEKEAEHLDLGPRSLKARVVRPEEVKLTKVVVRLPSGVKTAPYFLKLVRRQNGGVDPDRWAVLKQTPEGCLILGLDEPSMATLKSRKFQLLVGCGTSIFKLVGHNTAETGPKAQEKTQLMVVG